MENMEQIYYSKEILELLHKELDSLSPEFWHCVSRPYCPVCLEERGRAFMAEMAKERKAQK